MSHPLDGPRLKVERANEHIGALDREFGVFLEPYSDRSIIDHRFDGTWHIVSLSPVIDVPMPLRFSVICGDAIHNLRSALDHLVWQLVIAEGNRPGLYNSFPILKHRNEFKAKVVSPKDPTRSPLHGINPNGWPWALIEAEQPYKRGKPAQHYLTILGKLSNVDKHRTLHSGMLFPSADSIRDALGWNPAARLLELKKTLGPLPYKRETEVLRLRFSAAKPDPQMYVKGKVGLEPTFGDDKRFQLPLGSIKQVSIWIGEFIERFAPFF